MALQPTNVVLVLTTIPLDLDADRFARALVTERLAACVSVLAPMASTYHWQGTVESATERQVVMKTTAGRVAALEARVAELHPYDVPELLVVPLSGGGDGYLDWVVGEVRGEKVKSEN